jgi:hypothetical protein
MLMLILLLPLLLLLLLLLLMLLLMLLMLMLPQRHLPRDRSGGCRKEGRRVETQPRVGQLDPGVATAAVAKGDPMRRA